MNGNPKLEGKRPLWVLGPGWRGLTLQLVFVTILPLTLLLLVVTFGSIRFRWRTGHFQR